MTNLSHPLTRNLEHAPLPTVIGIIPARYGSSRLPAKPLIDLLRQRSRPYLFSNSLAPSIVAASIEALRILKASNELPRRLRANTEFFRRRMTELGLPILPGEHPIVPVMVGDATKAARMAEYLLHKGIYVIGFSYPVVPLGKARIRTQVCAAHTIEQLNWAAEMFQKAAAEVQ